MATEHFNYWQSLLTEPAFSDSLFEALSLQDTPLHRSSKWILRQALLQGTELQRILNSQPVASFSTTAEHVFMQTACLAASRLETLARHSIALTVRVFFA